MVRSNSISNVDLYQSELPQPQKEVVKRLRALIKRGYPELRESLKWHVPIYSQDCQVAARAVLGGLHHEYRWERIAA